MRPTQHCHIPIRIDYLLIKEVRSRTYRLARHHAPYTCLEQWYQTNRGLDRPLQLHRGAQSAATAGRQQAHQSRVRSAHSTRTTQSISRAIIPTRASPDQHHISMQAVAHNQAHASTQTELVLWIIVLVPRPPRMPSSPPPCFLPFVVGQINTDVTAPSSRAV